MTAVAVPVAPDPISDVKDAVQPVQTGIESNVMFLTEELLIDNFISAALAPHNDADENITENIRNRTFIY